VAGRAGSALTTLAVEPMPFQQAHAIRCSGRWWPTWTRRSKATRMIRGVARYLRVNTSQPLRLSRLRMRKHSGMSFTRPPTHLGRFTPSAPVSATCMPSFTNRKNGIQMRRRRRWFVKAGRKTQI
jgi:hypothetical protein